MNYSVRYVLTIFFVHLILVSCLANIGVNESKVVLESKNVGNTIKTDKGIVLDRYVIHHEDVQLLLDKFLEWVENFLRHNDPFRIEYTSLDGENKLIKSKGYLEKLLISDISSLKIISKLSNHTDDDLSQIIYLDLNVSSVSFKMSGHYQIDFSLLDAFFVNGGGEFDITLHDLNISSGLHIVIYPDNSLSVPWASVNYDVHKIQVKLDGLYGGGLISTLVNIILNDVLTKIANQYKSVISGVLSVYFHIFINRNIDNITMNNIIDTMSYLLENENKNKTVKI